MVHLNDIQNYAIRAWNKVPIDIKACENTMQVKTSIKSLQAPCLFNLFKTKQKEITLAKTNL